MDLSIMANIAVMASISKNSEPLAEADRLTATDAKNAFGSVLERVIRGGRVVITKHDAPKAVLISIDEFNFLTATGDRQLVRLTDQFDAMLERMQTREAGERMKAAFNAQPKRLARAAVSAARKRARSS
jgi:prevent-host-death family protein